MNETRTTLTVVTKDETYHYVNENEIEFIKEQLDDRTWIRLPRTIYSDNEYGVTYQNSKLIPRNRIIEISQTDKTSQILKEEN